jgi:hypothetical protein
MRRHICIGLVLVLLLQTGCYRYRHVPVPETGADTAAVRAVEDVSRVRVTTVTGAQYTLVDPYIEEPYLVGGLWSDRRILHQIRLDSIAEVHSIQLDPAKTVLGIAATGLLTVVVLATIIALTKDSCPLVYAVTTDGPVLEGEMYSGAVVPELERTDLLRLRHVVALDGSYVLDLSNEARETQFTDQLLLLAVDHEPGLEVLPGDDGALHTIARPLPPLSAVDGMGRDVLADVVAAGDAVVWVPQPEGRDLDDPAHLRDGLVLRFPVEPGATEAKLVVRIRNTAWADHMVGRLLGLMGDFMDTFYLADTAESPRGEKLATFLREQGLSLGATVLRGGAWVNAGTLHPTGPVAWQDEVLRIPLDGVGDTLTVRLEGGALFWLIDHVAVDYSPDQPLRVHVLAPVEATNSDGTDALPALFADDGVHHVLPDRGHSVRVRFPSPALAPGLERSFLAQAKGYYLIHQKQHAAPDLRTLAGLQAHPDGFLRYAIEEFWRLYDDPDDPPVVEPADAEAQAVPAGAANPAGAADAPDDVAWRGSRP